MSPPLYADLGKNAKDLFSKGYNVNFLKIDSTTKPHDQAEFKLNAAHNVSSGKLGGNVELKYKLPKYGLTLTEKWNTDSNISTELVAVDQGAKGSKFTLYSDYSVSTKSSTGKVKAEFAQDQVRANADVALLSTPIVNAAAVFGYQNWLVGVQSGYNTEKAALTNTNVSFGRAFGAYVLHASVNNQTQFASSLYHKVNDKVEVAANAAWTSGDAKPDFGLATQYKIDKDWSVKAKILQNSQFSASTTHSLNPHLTMTISGTVDLKNFNEGGHKFGAGLEYSPCC
jgi:hypothetical protein